jgi:hypothetical protein
VIVRDAKKVETQTQKRTRITQPNTVLVGGESHAIRNGAGFSFARAQKCEQMTAHEYQPRTATPAGGVKRGQYPCSGERRQTKPTCMPSKKNHIIAKRGVGGAGEKPPPARPHLGVAWC